MDFRRFFFFLFLLIFLALFVYTMVWFLRVSIRSIKADMAKNHLIIGKKKILLGDSQGAIEEFTKAIQSNPNFPTAYFSRATVKAALGDKHGAIFDYTDAIRLNRTFINGCKALEKHNSHIGNRQAALANRDTANQINSDLAGAYFNRGLLNHEIGDKSAGLEDLQRTVEILKAQGENDFLQDVLKYIDDLS
jgi:tetratricopeptide (TPR) repeat protein